MAFKKHIRGRLSKHYYMDFTVKGIHINRSTKTADYTEACKIESDLKAGLQAEQSQLDKHKPQAWKLSEALEWVWKEKWVNNRTSDRPYTQISTIIDLVGDQTLNMFSGEMGFHTIRKIKVLLSEDRGPVTVDRYLAALKTLLNVIRHELPMFDLQIPKIRMNNQETRRERILDEREERQLFRVMDHTHPEYTDLFRVLLDTGLRLSEALSLDYRKNIFLDKRQITVFSANTKSGKPRSIPMTKRVEDILSRRQKTSFPKPYPFTPTRADQVFRQVRIKLGFLADKDFTPHMLRHTCTTRLLRKGLPLLVVQAWLGHSDSKMTAHYSHFCVEDMRAGAEMLDSFNNR